MYEEDVALAANLGAQIVVFPEFGLGGNFLDRDSMLPFCGPLPAIGTTPCASQQQRQNYQQDVTFAIDNTSVVYQASCMAAKYKTIVVLNTCEVIPCSNSSTSETNETCPVDGRLQYNTEIVLDETGTLLAIYHKSHPFYINCFNTPHPYDVVTFNASFGVEFGIFICLDIAFDTPAQALLAQGVRAFSYSASIPNATASFAFETWTKKYQSSLLVSNLDHSVGGVYSPYGNKLPFSLVRVGNGDDLYITKVPM